MSFPEPESVTGNELPKEFSWRSREKLWKELTSAAQAQTIPIYDAVIVGGGIVGVGVARELTLRGKSVLLVEKNDFASGTSSRSSKLIHGGLRYLEMFDFGLVFESLSERHWLLKTHPHLVEPLEFVLPSFKKGFVSSKARSSTLLGLGLWAYDALALFRTPFFHGWHSAKKLAEKFPGMTDQGLRGGYYYADAMMMDDELVLECAAAAHARGAQLLNYVAATKISRRTHSPDIKLDAPFQVQLQNRLGDVPNESAEVLAREVLVCVGPWTSHMDSIIEGGSGKKLKPSRGTHLIFPWEKLPVDSCLVMYADDGRLIFTIPRKDFGIDQRFVIVGTTDAPDIHDPGAVRSQAEDIEYLFTVLKRYFPKLTLTKDDVLMSYSGIRPLLDDGEKAEAKVSREHEIWRNSAGVVFMAGGKYTTFRKISEEIADFAFPGTHPYYINKDNDSKAPLSDPLSYNARQSGPKLWGAFSEGWVHWKLRHHMPVTLEDVIFRRTPFWFQGRELSDEVLSRTAKICATAFSWSVEKTESEIALVKNKLSGRGF